jgi:chemotaxis protein methyltransferase CheR
MDDSARLGTFDIVFCRNVLIYFDLPTKKKVLDQIYRRLRPEGFLFLGAAETVLGISEQFRLVPGASGLYRSTKALDENKPKQVAVMAA